MNQTFEAYAKEMGRDPYSQAAEDIANGGGFQEWLDAKFEDYLKLNHWDGVTPWTEDQLTEFRKWVVSNAKALSKDQKETV